MESICRSHLGLVRQNNEDRCYVDPDGRYAALADGIASNTVRLTLRDSSNAIVANSPVVVALTGTGTAVVGAIPPSTDENGFIDIE